MNKKLLILFLFIVLPFQLNAKEKELLIYSYKYIPMIETINKMFYKKTGVVISVVNFSEDKFLNQLSDQEIRSKVDMVIGSTLYGMVFIRESGYLQKIDDSFIKEIIPEGYQDKKDFLIPISVNPRLLVYNNNIIQSDIFNLEYSSYMDIFPNKITTSQRTFLNKYNRELVAHYLKNYDEKQVKRWLLNLSNNILEKPKGNDRYSLRKVAKGDSAYTFANGSDLGLMLNSKNKTEKYLAKSLSFEYDRIDNFDENNQNIANDLQENSIPINLATIGILNDSSNKEIALEYVKFLLSKDIQNYIAKTSYEIPIHKDVSSNKMYFSIKEKIPDTVNYENIIFYNIKASNLIKESSDFLR